MRAQVPVGFGGGNRGGGDGAAELHALVQGRHVTHAQAAFQRWLADQQNGQRGSGIEVMVREHPDRLQLLAGEQVRFVHREDDVPVPLVCLSG